MNIITSINKKEWSSITSIASTIYFKKGELVLRKGDRSDKEFFLEKGIVRGFIVDEGGNEKSIAFFQEGEFMSTKTLRTRKDVSLYSYQALCATKILLFDSGELKQLLSENKKLSEIGKEIKERELIRISNRDDCLMQVRAKEKYISFLKFYPNLEKQISQRYIASYLGITPVSLSRLKKSMIS